MTKALISIIARCVPAISKFVTGQLGRTEYR